MWFYIEKSIIKAIPTWELISSQHEALDQPKLW